jgi:predicted metalloprotease with PDZ domain
LLLAGIVNCEDDVKGMNEVIYRYDTQVGTNVSLEEFIRRHTAKPTDLDQLDKRRGAVLALWLDAEIRYRSNERASLDQLMFALLKENRIHKERHNGMPLALTNSRIYRAVNKIAGPSVTKRLREYVRNGGIILVPDNPLGSCVRTVMEDVPSFDLGFDPEYLNSPEHRARGVKERGPAYRAGLRDGQELVGWSIYKGDTSKPVKLTIKDSRGTRVLEYLPIGATVGVQRFELDEELYKVNAAGVCAAHLTHPWLGPLRGARR